MPYCVNALVAACMLMLAPGWGQAVQVVSETPKTFSASLPTDPRLAVGIVKDSSKLPRPTKDTASRPHYVMTDSAGKRFTCYTFNDTTPASQELQPLQGQIFPPVVTKSPFDLLDSLTGLCLYRQQGLWTYEWCHKKSVRQIRQEVSSKKGEEFTCGSWPGEEAQVEEIEVDHTISSVPMKYVSHNFTDGDACTLTGEPRTAEVRFTCMKDVTDSIIFSVKEFPTCNYVYVVATPFLCKHPDFKPQPEAVSSIICVPESQPGQAVALVEDSGSSSTRSALEGSSRSDNRDLGGSRADGNLGVPKEEGGGVSADQVEHRTLPVENAHQAFEVVEDPSSQAPSGALPLHEEPSDRAASDVPSGVVQEQPSSQPRMERGAHNEGSYEGGCEGSSCAGEETSSERVGAPNGGSGGLEGEMEQGDSGTAVDLRGCEGGAWCEDEHQDISKIGEGGEQRTGIYSEGRTTDGEHDGEGSDAAEDDSSNANSEPELEQGSDQGPARTDL